MPIYEYECRRCAHRFEIIQKFGDKPRKRCPECSGAVDRLISAPAIRFKGTGWYVTDYADDKKKAADKAADTDSGTDPAAAAEKSEKPGKSEKSEKGEKSERSDPAASKTKGRKGKKTS